MELTRRRPARRLVLRALGTAVAITASALVAPQPVAARPDTPVPAETLSRGALADPDQALGPKWTTSTDQLVTGAGDRNGFHVYLAREREAFAWSMLTTLNAGLPDAGAWTGSVCVTGSGKRAVAVYAPVSYTNKPELATKGAYVAVVDLTTGKATPLRERVQLAYYNPSCGTGERVLVTRPTDVGQQTTEVLAIDAAAGRVTSTVRLAGQFTNAAPAADGDYGILRGGLHRLRAGKLTKIADPGGRPFAVRATAAGAIDVLTVDAPKQGVADRATAHRYVGRRHTVLGTAPATGLELVGLSGGRNALVGDLGGIRQRPSDLVMLPAAGKTRVASRQGHLLAMSVLPVETGRADHRSSLAVTVRATDSGQVSRRTVTATAKPPADVAPPRAGRIQTPQASIAAGEVISNPAYWPTCAIPRNDIRRQVLQPSANQVEWAVDLAVQGKLTITRPANYLKTGMASYTPQGLFPWSSSDPRVPAQVMLAVLAQETNMAQASWHASPGDGGNPLVSDYYGTRSSAGWDYIDYSSSDCGYGISQVTDGMREDQTCAVCGPGWTELQRVAIATDYTANIAAGLQILVEKFQQVQSLGISVNTNDPRYIENWFLAVWAYNSGVHTADEPGSLGNYGLGWYNNPANPSYPANRAPFLRLDQNDASHPSDWSYPERIMGWAEVPQWQWIDPYTKYSTPTFGSTSNQLSLPGMYQFCQAANNCSPFGDNSSCDESCWWHSDTSWVTEANPLSTEKLVYAVGSAEPAAKRVYPKVCTPFSATGALIVDDLADSSMNPLGCAGQSWGGKFTLRLGSPAGDLMSFHADIDLHQLGAGYLGHMWFSHSMDPDYAGLHKIVGTWTPNIRSGTSSWDIVVHLPSHGANETGASYYIERGRGVAGDPAECPINQDAETLGVDRWVSLGRYTLGPGARVQLSNMIAGSTGDVDIAWDAMAFVPASGTAKNCGTTW
ncbi:hypothetical protein Q2K19_11415 [Micromonospora soli]|uniref:hypothetical protein n=1 Tax=Micromonospora sp. NBRC 110009 TaxID=3061627 RepID=UPI00267350E6|nr:hypothetical protein [Micromonospora sp. NBRC 110009]WKU01031.1 hypothetical protein Q2K19_11415 [Micromonospora sp. NBRC 110009]